MAKSQPASTPKSTSTKTTAQKSSILKSSFAPSRFQLRLFASVIQSFDSQQLRIHDTTTGRLRSQHTAKPGCRITCLDWGHARSPQKGGQKPKSRKKDDIMLAYGTSTSDVCLFSPTEGRVLAELSGQHERGVLDLKFAEDTNDLWSIGGDGKLVQWNIETKKALQTISLPEPSPQILAPIFDSSSILCASTTPYIIRLDKSENPVPTFDAMQYQIHSLDRSKDAILAADGERYINLYGQNGRLSRTLVARSEVQNFSIDFGEVSIISPEDQQVLVAVGKDGVVELFPKPFTIPQSQNGLKSSRKDLTQKSLAQIQLLDSASKKAFIFAASIQGGDIVIASATGGVDLNFQKVRWQDEGSGELLFSSTKEVVQSKAASTLSTANMNGVKDMGKPYVDESSTVVTNGLGVGTSQEVAIGIDSTDEEEDNDSESGADIPDQDQDSAAASDEEMDDAPPIPSSTIAPATSDPAPTSDPTFGDLLVAKTTENKIIPITTTISQMPTLTASGALPTGMSLTTALTQSLHTNDSSLLESCLHEPSPAIIRNTLTRLDSALAATLISKLADRIITRPGRYGHLQIWIQTLCIAHGAAISSNVEARERLKELYRALDRRAKSLPSLLLLKGKLQMVEGQLRFRRELAAARVEAAGGSNSRNVNVFIEGGADNWDSDDDDAETAVQSKKRARRDLDELLGNASDEEDEDDDEEMPAALTNGVDSDSDNESHSSMDEEVAPNHLTNGAVIDDEAIESDVEDSDMEAGSASAASDSAASSGEEDEDEEEDSEMDDFINDGEISVDEDDAVLDDAAASDNEEPAVPVAKDSKKGKKSKRDTEREKPQVKRRKV